MEAEKHKLKEPGLVRLLLGVGLLGCAILVGFLLGLRAGDRSRRVKQEVDPIQLALLSPDTMAAAAVDAVVVDTASVDTLAVEIPAVEAEPKPASFSKQQVAQGVEYLASHNRWNRGEMEKIPVLQGLWDAVNTYDLESIRSYNDLLSSTPLTAVVEGLEKKPKKGYYAAKADPVITLSTYIKRLR